MCRPRHTVDTNATAKVRLGNQADYSLQAAFPVRSELVVSNAGTISDTLNSSINKT